VGFAYDGWDAWSHDLLLEGVNALMRLALGIFLLVVVLGAVLVGPVCTAATWSLATLLLPFVAALAAGVAAVEVAGSGRLARVGSGLAGAILGFIFYFAVYVIAAGNSGCYI
jgi:hypothetical protein